MTGYHGPTAVNIHTVRDAITMIKELALRQLFFKKKPFSDLVGICYYIWPFNLNPLYKVPGEYSEEKTKHHLMGNH